MDEEDDEDDYGSVVGQREVVVEKATQPPRESQEEQYPPEPAPDPESPEVECRFFTQSEFVNADPEQKAFIRECDRAAGRTGVTPAREKVEEPEPREASMMEPEYMPYVPSVKAEQGPTPSTPAAPGRDVDCGDFNPPSAAQPYLLPGDPYGLDGDNDGLACE